MRTLLKLIAFIVIFIILGLVTLLFIVNPNDYKQQISEQVEKATGRALTLDGDISLSVFPWIALELGSVSLSNAAGFEAKQFAQIDGAQIRIKLMPLLKKQLEMDTIVLDGLILNLEKNKAGKTNWDDLGGQSEQKSKVKAEEHKSSEPALAALSIAGIELTNANILWSDKQSANQYTINNLNLKTDPLKPGQSTSVELNFDLLSDKKLTANVGLNSKLSADMENQLFTLSDFTFTTAANGRDIPDVNLSLTTDITADLAQQLFTLKQITLDTKATGNSLPLPEINFTLNGDLSADLNQQTADLSQLLIQIQDLVIESDIKATQILSEQPQFSGQLAVNPFNLRQLVKQLAVELPAMSDNNTLELVQLNSKLSGSTDHVSLDNLTLTLDQSQLTGQFSVRNFAKPALKFKLKLDEINADRYMPLAEDKSTGSAATPATASAAAASELPLDTLRDLNIVGSLNIGQLKISGTQSNDISININAKDGVIKLHPLKAQLYQGQYQGNVNLNAQGNKLKLGINENLSNIQAGPLLKDLSGDDKVSGLVNAKVKLTGQGKTVAQIKQTLSGNGDFSFTDGSLKGINIADSIRRAKAALKGEPLPKTDSVVKTDFSSFKGSFTANNGLINNPDLVLMSPLLRVGGAGAVDINKEDIDYGLEVAIVGSTEGQEGRDLAELKGLVIPLKITGSFNDPKPNVDLATLLRDNATQKVKDKVTDKLKDKLGGDLGNIVGGALLGNKKSTGENDVDAAEKRPEKSVEDELKDALGGKLKGLF